MADPGSGEFTMPRTRSGEAEARETLGDIFPPGASGLLDRSMLLLSELFSGQREFGGGIDHDVGVKVGTANGTVRVEVRDAGSGYVMDVLRQPSATGRRGWSPHLLSTVADRWGLVSGDAGAWVWFELDYPEGEPS